MPPAGMPRPDATTYHSIASFLEAEIDRAWATRPNPGRINAVHRLNRVEYNNAIRDLFALDVDVTSKLPGDETADGSFDNFADVLSISTTHLERYLSVARQVTRLAVGLPPSIPAVERFEIPLHVVQDDRQSEDLPFGSRGGIAIRYDFPVDGEYLIKVRLRRQYQDYVMGMGWPQQLDLRLDGALVKRFTVGGGATGRPAAASYAGDGEPGFAGDAEWEKYMQIEADAGLEIRMPVKAGPHRDRRLVRQGDVGAGGPAATAAARQGADERPDLHGLRERRRAVDCRPVLGAKAWPGTRRAAARSSSASLAANLKSATAPTKILSRIARLAYRRPVSAADVQTLLGFFTNGRREGGNFDAGIQFALERVLVDPDFLLRVYRDPGHARRSGVSAERSRAGVTPVVLPVEQHSRRAADRCRRAR